MNDAHGSEHALECLDSIAEHEALLSTSEEGPLDRSEPRSRSLADDVVKEVDGLKDGVVERDPAFEVLDQDVDADLVGASDEHAVGIWLTILARLGFRVFCVKVDKDVHITVDTLQAPGQFVVVCQKKSKTVSTCLENGRLLGSVRYHR